MPAVDVLEKVATGVAEQLAAGTFSLPLVVERSYADWELPLEGAEAGELRADVVPVNNPVTELLTRGDVAYQAAVDIVVRKKLKISEQEPATGRIAIDQIDALVGLVLEIHEHFLAAHLESYELAAWEKTEIRAAFIPRHLRQHRQFTGIVRVTFQVTRPM